MQLSFCETLTLINPQENLRSLTREAQQLMLKDLPWEPLEVTPPVALEIFSHSRCLNLLHLPFMCQTVSYLNVQSDRRTGLTTFPPNVPAAYKLIRHSLQYEMDRIGVEEMEALIPI